MESSKTVGSLLKSWRERRKKSQMDLALDAEISTRHLSFVETGRAKPSREMILLLSEQLEIPLRERNAILLAGGYAPTFSEMDFQAPSMRLVREAIEVILEGHEPFPALAIDHHWNMIAANKSIALLLDEFDPRLLEPPVNVLRLTLNPQGLAPRIVNLPEWRVHILQRLKKQAVVSADPLLDRLYEELKDYGQPAGRRKDVETSNPPIVVPLRIESRFGILSFITTTTVFGTPLDITVSEIALETFFPADDLTREVFRGLQ